MGIRSWLRWLVRLQVGCRDVGFVARAVQTGECDRRYWAAVGDRGLDCLAMER